MPKKKTTKSVAKTEKQKGDTVHEVNKPAKILDDYSKEGAEKTKEAAGKKVETNVLVKKLHENAKLPTRAHPTDAGLDLYALEDFEIHRFERKLIKTGIAMAIPKGYVGFIKEKSGLSLKKGIEIHAGVIDSPFRGEVGVVMTLPRGHTQDENGMKTFNETVSFKAGDKIAQMIILPVNLESVREVDELPDSDRGEGGYGSSGK